MVTGLPGNEGQNYGGNWRWTYNLQLRNWNCGAELPEVANPAWTENGTPIKCVECKLERLGNFINFLKADMGRDRLANKWGCEE
jgi:hypothetical protein